jgi:beta-galactosidase/beta-glucuronidase
MHHIHMWLWCTKLGILFCVTVFDFGFGVLLAQVARPNSPPLVTSWAKDVSLADARPEYPRPVMVREDWLNLNGQWNYAVTIRSQTNSAEFKEKILVPFAIESVLSGVRRVFNEQQRLTYRRTFTVPPEWRGRRVLLHFEAVNWETEVFVNGQSLGTHRGGYDGFNFDITDALKTEGEQALSVSVTNPIETGSEPRGKQMLHSRVPFFSEASGIWQTVWLEPVSATSIESVKLVPDVDAVKGSVKNGA